MLGHDENEKEDAGKKPSTMRRISTIFKKDKNKDNKSSSSSSNPSSPATPAILQQSTFGSSFGTETKDETPAVPAKVSHAHGTETSQGAHSSLGAGPAPRATPAPQIPIIVKEAHAKQSPHQPNNDVKKQAGIVEMFGKYKEVLTAALRPLPKQTGDGTYLRDDTSSDDDDEPGMWDDLKACKSLRLAPHLG